MESSDLLNLLAVGAFLAGLGRVVNGIVFPPGTAKAGAPGWRGVYYVTMSLHPVLLGAACGVPSWFSAPPFMGEKIAGRVIWFALAGLFSGTCYEAISSVIKHSSARTRNGSLRPPAPDAVDAPAETPSDNAG